MANTNVSHISANHNIGASLDKTVVNAIDTNIDNKETVKVFGVTLCDLMQDQKVDMTQFPRVGSRGGNNPHYFPLPDDAEKEGDAFVEIYKGTANGELYVRKLKDLALGIKVDTASQMTFAEHKGKSVMWCKDEINLLKARITAGGSMLEKAVACYQQEHAFGQHIDPKLVLFDRKWDDKDKGIMKRTRSPYILANMSDLTDNKSLTVEQFIALDVMAAKQNGGTYAALIKTLSKGTGEGTKEGIKIEKLNDFLGVFDAVSKYLSNVTEDGAKRAENFENWLQSKDHAKERILAFGDFMETLQAKFEEVQVDYRTYAAERRKETKSLEKDENKNKAVA